MITIDEAAQKWSCSKNTVLSYVYKRYITGMCVDGEMLLLPDIKKPYIPRKRFDVSLDYYKALLRTIRREQFIDEHILGISKEKYSAYIEELEGAGYIKKVEPDAGISGYILTTKGNNELKKKGEISFVKELNITASDRIDKYSKFGQWICFLRECEAVWTEFQKFTRHTLEHNIYFVTEIKTR